MKVLNLRATNQRVLEWAGSVGMCAFMLLAMISFYYAPNEAIFRAFSNGLGFTVQPLIFMVLCGLGAICYLLMLTRPIRRKPARTKWILWSLCGSPIILYTVPVAYYLNETGSFSIAVVVYVAIYFLISFAGACLHRG